MALTSEIKSTMHDDDVVGVEIEISLMAFIKDLYPTYYHYLDSLQVSGQLKSFDFDSLVEKNTKRGKAFEKKTIQTTGENMCLDKKGKNQSHDPSRGACNKRGRRKKDFRGIVGRHNPHEKIDL